MQRKMHDNVKQFTEDNVLDRAEDIQFYCVNFFFVVISLL